MIKYFIIAIPALPLLSALLVHLLSETLGRRVSQVSVAAGVLTFLAATGLLWLSIDGGDPGQAS